MKRLLILLLCFGCVSAYSQCDNKLHIGHAKGMPNFSKSIKETDSVTISLNKRENDQLLLSWWVDWPPDTPRVLSLGPSLIYVYEIKFKDDSGYIFRKPPELTRGNILLRGSVQLTYRRFLKKRIININGDSTLCEKLKNKAVQYISIKDIEILVDSNKQAHEEFKEEYCITFSEIEARELMRAVNCMSQP